MICYGLVDWLIRYPMTAVVKVVFTSCPTRGGQQRNQFTAVSATSLTELEQTYSSGLVIENNMSLFAGIPEYFFLFKYIFSADKTSKKIDRYLVNREAAI